MSQLLAGQGQLLAKLFTQPVSLTGVSARQLKPNVGLLLMSTAAVRMAGHALREAIAAQRGIPHEVLAEALLSLPGIGRSLPLDHRSSQRHATGQRKEAPIRATLGARQPATFIVAIGVLLGEAVGQIFLSRHLTARGYGPEAVGLVGSAAGLGDLIARPVLGQLTVLTGRRWPLAMTPPVVGGLSIGAVPWVSGAAVYGLLSVLSGAISGIWPALATVRLAKPYPRHEQALALPGPAVLGLMAST